MKGKSLFIVILLYKGNKTEDAAELECEIVQWQQSSQWEYNSDNMTKTHTLAIVPIRISTRWDNKLALSL